MIEKEWVDKQTEHMQNIFDEHGVNMTELMLIGQTFALLFTWQLQQKEGHFYQSLREKYGAIVDELSEIIRREA
jgi:hypothetical protein